MADNDVFFDVDNDNRYARLQRDRNTRRWLSQTPGVDADKYDVPQLRVLEKSRSIISEYRSAAVKGAMAGAVGGSLFFGVGAGFGALLGAAAGIGYRAYGAHADYIDLALTKFQAELDEE